MSGVVTEVSVDVGLPASPVGLLHIATAFEAQGYERLGRYLRACADQLAIATAPEPVGIFECQSFASTGDQKNRVEVTLIGPAEAQLLLRKARRYALVELVDAVTAVQQGPSHGL